MRKRLRKKLRKGEFQEMGFQVKFHLLADLDEPCQGSFFDTFIEQAIEGNGLICGGGFGTAWDVFVTLDGRGSATEEHRRRVRDWLLGNPVVSSVQVGSLVDAWYSV